MSAYTGYLSNLKEKATVVATEDIVSDRGVLIVRSGAELNNKTYDNLLKFKLLKPLEDSIAISNQLNAKLIYDRVNQFILMDPWLRAIHNELGNKLLLQRSCLNIEKYSLLLQKLTVLSMEIPHIFDQAILSGYLCHVCGIVDQLPQEELNDYFLAGLSHDIGFLHIDKNILDKEEALTGEEWKTIQSHPIISYEILKRIDRFPKRVCRSVLEHHENLDGTGYPRAKTAHDLSSLGQVVNLVDNVIGIYNKKFKPINRSFRDIIPIIQINMHSYFPDAISMILRLLKHAPESPKEKTDATIVSSLIEYVQKEQAYIQSVIEMIQHHNDIIGFTHNDKEVYAIQNIAINIIMITNSAGLSDSSYSDWLEDMKNNNPEDMYNEVEDTRVMLGEVIYQLQNYQKTASLFISKYPTHPMTEKVETILNHFGEFNRAPTPAPLKKHWEQLAKRKVV